MLSSILRPFAKKSQHFASIYVESGLGNVLCLSSATSATCDFWLKKTHESLRKSKLVQSINDTACGHVTYSNMLKIGHALSGHSCPH